MIQSTTYLHADKGLRLRSRMVENTLWIDICDKDEDSKPPISIRVVDEFESAIAMLACELFNEKLSGER